MNGNSVLRIISSKRLGGLAAGLAFLLITACTPPVGTQPAAQDDPTPEAASPLADTKWKLVFFGEPDAETPVIEGSSITLSFDAVGRAGGSGGCNAYGAGYEVKGNKLSFGEIASTLMACEQDGIGEQEQRYFQALEASGRFELFEDRLTIWYGDEQSALNWLKDVE